MKPPVASLKLSKELAGYVILDTYFYWFNRVKLHEGVGDSSIWHYDACDYTLVDYLKIKQFNIDKKRASGMIQDCGRADYIPAPLSDELGAVLPASIIMGGKHYYGYHICQGFDFAVDRDGRKWCYYYTNGEENYLVNNNWDFDTEANSRAKILLYLHKKNLIEREVEA